MNKVVLIGEDYYTLLGLVRSFGINEIRPYGIIIGPKHYAFLSKYWAKVWCVKTADEAIDLLVSIFGVENQKPVVLASTDEVVKRIDSQYCCLSRKFIIPSINNEESRILEMMDKEKQQGLFRKLGFNTLKTETVYIGRDKSVRQLPIILKPVVSAEGKKSDIRICRNSEEYKDAVEFFEKLGYKRILAQKYLSVREEYVVVGAVSTGMLSYTVLHNLRQWPKEKGTGCYSELVDDRGIIEYVNALLLKIQDMGYDGPIDIEFFKDDQGIFYPNEVNWRSSGRSFIGVYTGVQSSYLWYLYKTGENIDDMTLVSNMKGIVITETADIRSALSEGIPFIRWVKQLIASNAYALWYVKDIKPFFGRIWDIMSRRKCQ